ncbi:hypothetical protein P872_11545 [Rhodonellum psychrophilum GCM71 = DSM 17998]|uniref:GH16 domain-containing protein n=2 Tax=Rhodonellum TaxID=336827 RepID=U5BU21_9BACT|nr:hypothetical protein P872_11545 [Rhodonellum psychrophilum GCM71 = DSM 17998]
MYILGKGEIHDSKFFMWDNFDKKNETNGIVLIENTTNNVPSNKLGKLLWSATHEIGNQNEWNGDGGGGEYNSGTGNSAVSTTVARTGKYSLKLSLNTTSGDSHGTRNYRWKEIGNNADLIFTQYFYFPHRIDLDPMNDWFNLIQTKGVKYAAGGPGTGPDQINNPHFVVGIDVRGGAGSGGANYLTLADLQKFWSGNSNVVWRAPQGLNLPTNKWVKIQMRIIQDTGNNGRILLWQDDVLVVDTGLRNTLRPEVDASHFSINAYADKTFPNVTTFYLDDLTINLPEETTSQKFKVTTAELPSTGGKILIAQFAKDTNVEITSPLDNSSITKNSNLIIKAIASSTISEVQKIEYYQGEVLLGISVKQPHEFNWSNVSEGVYQLKIKAYFNNGDTKFSYINRVTVK